MLIDSILGVLAVLGLGALLLRLVGALLGLGLTAVEASHAASVAEASARRGDITAMLEGRDATRSMRRRRLRSLAWVAIYAALLVGSPVLGVAKFVYAGAALLWALPGGRPRMQIRTWRSGR